MSTADEEFTKTAELARRIKRETAATWKPGMSDKAADMQNHAVVFRGERVVGQVWVEPRGGMPQAAYAAAGFMRSDVVFVVGDGLSTTEMIDKIEDVPKHGDLGDAWRDGQRDGITEVLYALRITPDEVEFREWPYRREGNVIHWTEVEEWRRDKKMVIGGDVVNAARAGFEFRKTDFIRFESIVQTVIPKDFLGGIDYEHHLDRAVARWLSETTHTSVALFNPPAAFMDGKELPVPPFGAMN
jgi:hypothetical protein